MIILRDSIKVFKLNTKRKFSNSATLHTKLEKCKFFSLYHIQRYNEISLYHIYRHLNTISNKLANQGTTLRQGMLEINKNQWIVSLPCSSFNCHQNKIVGQTSHSLKSRWIHVFEGVGLKLYTYGIGSSCALVCGGKVYNILCLLITIPCRLDIVNMICFKWYVIWYTSLLI